MAKTQLTDLNNYLFAQLERLSEETLSEEQIDLETKRAKEIANVSDKILKIAQLSLHAEKLMSGGDINQLPQSFDPKRPLDKLERKQ